VATNEKTLEGRPAAEPGRVNWSFLKEVALTFLTGVLLFLAAALLLGKKEEKSVRKPASTVYGVF
jgi:hypothetical protein